MKSTLKRRLGLSVAVALLSAEGTTTQAQEIFAGKFGQQTGEEIYQGICQGCHMPDARGAVGAGAYPALAKDPRLAAAIYPITVVLNGQRAMPALGDAKPPFNASLTDEQIANVLNYVRTHFDNHYKDVITPQTVKAARPSSAPQPTAESAGANAVSH